MKLMLPQMNVIFFFVFALLAHSFAERRSIYGTRTHGFFSAHRLLHAFLIVTNFNGFIICQHSKWPVNVFVFVPSVRGYFPKKLRMSASIMVIMIILHVINFGRLVKYWRRVARKCSIVISCVARLCFFLFSFKYNKCVTQGHVEMTHVVEVFL